MTDDLIKRRKPLKPTVGTGRPQTEAQQAASKHNFACFTLKGWNGNLQFIKGQVPESNFLALEAAIKNCLMELAGEKSKPNLDDCTQMENWALIGVPGTYRLTGSVKGHPSRQFGEHDLVTTSFLRSYDPVHKIAVTNSGTRYKLGKPHSAFKDPFEAIAAAKFQPTHQPKEQ